MTKVLIVDDEMLMRKGLCTLIDWAALGCEVIGTAENGLRAKQVITSIQPNIVISDIKMPVVDGLALAKWVDETYPDSLSIELNNFRTDKDELWVSGKSSNPDWTSYGTDWNGDNKLYVQEYMNYHIDNPKLDKHDTERYDLRDTVISLSVSNRPTLSIEFIGNGSTQHAYTESYVDGIYTLTITHNGRVKVTLT